MAKGYKSIDLTQLDGIATYQDTLELLQTNVLESFGGLARAFGDLVILQGCNDNGSSVGNGWVSINDEVLPFVGGAKGVSPRIIIEELADTELFGNASAKTVYYTRVAKLAVTGGYDYTLFKRTGILERLERLERIGAPFLPVFDAGTSTMVRGGMVLWNKPAILIPADWQEVVDWRGRLPLGYDPGDTDFNTVATNGGGKTHTLSVANLPPHKHDIIGSNATGFGGGGKAAAVNNTGAETAGQTENGSGNSQAVDHMNPYRTVIFIEYIGA